MYATYAYIDQGLGYLIMFGHGLGHYEKIVISYLIVAWSHQILQFLLVSIVAKMMKHICKMP